ncbi:RecB family exonuclease [Natronoglycomyces albus]|uniref:PD-(D/E)XK nuclease family protein n=1 Tax=Natronoglycomyces albus TaxID=2811108 RepID=A0A895XN03_9ACTN|nr:PD-(D/E)XK nuclease family protein [Natronoglycomyces albus]QSB06734.1 PD-(D/E)XK nuclease family protein [Natronoglycomyces albus]
MSVSRPRALSPSRASDFKQCPLLYRLRAIDKLPEPPSQAQVKGTLVHAVLDQLYEVDARRRTVEEALTMLEPQWSQLRQKHQEEYADLFASSTEESLWLKSARGLVESYFGMEDPSRLEPASRESFVGATLADGTRLRGVLDRADIAPAGQVRLVDYKTGKAPPQAYQDKALFQMKFYALVWWRTHEVVPTLLRLMYLQDQQVLDYSPTAEELEKFERTVQALWAAMQEAMDTGDFQPRTSKLCGWCAHQKLCPEFGGTPPAYPLPLPLAGT